MTIEEYQQIQAALDKHLERYKHYSTDTSKQREAYERAVLACKSVVANYNPKEGYRRNSRLEECK